MQKFNVVRAKKYTANGEEKTIWLNVGMITRFDNGGEILELNDRTEVYQIFPFKKKEEQQPTNNYPQQAPSADDIKVEQIPF